MNAFTPYETKTILTYLKRQHAIKRKAEKQIDQMREELDRRHVMSKNYVYTTN